MTRNSLRFQIIMLAPIWTNEMIIFSVIEKNFAYDFPSQDGFQQTFVPELCFSFNASLRPTWRPLRLVMWQDLHTHRYQILVIWNKTCKMESLQLGIVHELLFLI